MLSLRSPNFTFPSWSKGESGSFSLEKSEINSDLPKAQAFSV